MSKIKLYLIKLHNKLIYETISVDESLKDKIISSNDDKLILVSGNYWVASDTKLTRVTMGSLGIDYVDGLFLNFSPSTVNKTHTIEFKSNEERDIWYDRILRNLRREWVKYEM